MKVLAISSSPRKNGNSETLLQQALLGAKNSSTKIELVCLRNHAINPCTGCNRCYDKGCCVIKDDFQTVYEKALGADRLIFATPVYFMSVSAQAKLFIDRTQCAWAKSFVLKKPFAKAGSCGLRQASVIAVAAQKSNAAFEAIDVMMRYCLPNLGYNYVSNLFVSGADEIGAINKCPQALKSAFDLGSGCSNFLVKKEGRQTTKVFCQEIAAKEEP